MEVEVLLWRCSSKSLLNFVNLALRIFIGPRIRESKVHRLTWWIAKEMLEADCVLIIVIEEVIYFSEDASPLWLRVRQRPEYWLQTGSVKFTLII